MEIRLNGILKWKWNKRRIQKVCWYTLDFFAVEYLSMRQMMPKINIKLMVQCRNIKLFVCRIIYSKKEENFANANVANKKNC